MDVDWTPYRGSLQRAFFGPENWKLADRSSELERLFLRFFGKLQEQLKRFNILFFYSM